MKERAGVTGSTGVNQILSLIRAQNPKIKLHLIGHSFGGRLVTSAIAGSKDQPPVKVDTLTLLQAAFSHYGFSVSYDGSNDGFFRKVVAGEFVAGPTLITCTENDLAVGKAYPLASLLAGQIAADLGDKNDKYGGIGRNGAQKTPEASDGTLLKVGGAYKFQAGKLYNLNADAVIKGHSDICHDEIAYALFKAIAAA
jgi:pimeloyl-ACP methyl ester carboxylesterase